MFRLNVLTGPDALGTYENRQALQQVPGLQLVSCTNLLMTAAVPCSRLFSAHFASSIRLKS